MKHISFKNNPYTTILGLIVTLIGLALFTLPYFVELQESVEWYQSAGCFAVGILLLLSPDTLLGIIKKRSDSI